MAETTVMLTLCCLFLVAVLADDNVERNCTSQPQIPCTEQDEECSELMKEYKLLMKCPIPFETNLLNTTPSTLDVQWSYTFRDQDTIDGFLFNYGSKCRTIRLQNIRTLGQSLNKKEVNFSITINDMDSRTLLIPILLRNQQPDRWNAVLHYDRNPTHGSVKVTIETMTNVSCYTVEVMIGSCASTAFQFFTIFKSVFHLYNLTSESYCLRIRPKDPYPLDPLRCACYEGIKLCRTCHRICPATVGWFNFSQETTTITTTQFYEEQSFGQTMNHVHKITVSAEMPQTTSHVAAIVGGVLGGVASLVLLFTIFKISHRNIRQTVLRKFTGLHRRNVVVVAMEDDINILTLLTNLIDCLENHCLCDVSTIKLFDKWKSLDSTSMQELTKADRIIIVNTNKFSSEYENWISQVDFTSCKMDVSMFYYLKCLANEKVNKIVVIEFTTYSKYENNIVSILGKPAYFQLLRQFEEFVCCLHAISKRQASLIYSQPYKNIAESKEFKLLETSISSIELNLSEKNKSNMSGLCLDSNFSEMGFSISDVSYDRIQGSDSDTSVQEPGCDFSTDNLGHLTLKSSCEEICDTNSEDILRITTNLREMGFEECISIAGESV